MMTEDEIVERVRDTLVKAGSSFGEDKKEAYRLALEKETNENARKVLTLLIENAEIAEKNKSPLCDDTGIPHLVLEVGADAVITGRKLDAIKEGIKEGLRMLPGRPMAVLGDEKARLDQSLGLDESPEAVESAPILLCRTEENLIKLHILMFGGGPAIRAKTYRVFHCHSVDIIISEIVEWAKEAIAQLGCTPCTLAVGIGRSHYEAAAMMLMAQVEGSYMHQSAMEKEITDRVNEAGIGPLGLHGKTTLLATFMKVGLQRASGVRIVCMRPCCCFEPRIATVELN